MKTIKITTGTFNEKEIRIEVVEGSDKASVFTDGQYNGEFPTNKADVLIARLEDKTETNGTTN